MELKTKSKQAIRGTHTFTLTEDGKVIQQFTKTNIIVNNGLNAVCAYLGGGEVYGMNYCGLGTGAGVIAVTDTQLAAEGARKARGDFSQDTATKSVIVSFYFNPGEANGTWTRYGTFIGGTAVANSGTFFTHLDIGSLVKSAGQGLTISSEYTLSEV